MVCPIAHGIGLQHCVRGSWGACHAQTCDPSYTLTSFSSGCVRFAQLYLLLLGTSVVVGIVAVLFVLILSLIFTCSVMKRRRTKAEVNFWDTYAIVHPVRWALAAGTLISVAGSSAQLLQPVIIGQLFTRLATATAFSQVQKLFWYLIFLMGMEFIFTTLADMVFGYVGEYVLKRFRDRLFLGIGMKKRDEKSKKR